jgi:glycosyltransferase involved in cell wall biosynthesis
MEGVREAITSPCLRRIALALEYPLMQQGGTEVLVQELIRSLSSSYEIVLVSGDIDAKALPQPISRFIQGQISWDSKTRTAQAAQALAAELARHKVELVHFHFGGTFVWDSNRFWRCPVYHVAGAGIPCLATNHLATEWLNCGVHPDRPRWQKHLFQLLAIMSRSMIYRRLQLEVCVSKHDRARVARMFPHFRNKITHHYHSLLSEEEAGPELEDRRPVILCVGTIGGRKGQPHLAEAFARIAGKHSSWHLEFIGRTEIAADEERARASARHAGVEDRVHFCGRLSDEETKARMKRASIFAMPSLQEGLGLALQEALFHGCVGIGSRVGGIPELIDEDQNGLLIPPGDVGALSAALDKLMSDPELLARLRLQTRKSIVSKGMTARAMTQSYLHLYEECLSRRKRLEASEPLT